MPLGQSTIAAILGGEAVGLGLEITETIRGKEFGKWTKRGCKAGAALVTGGITALATADAPGAVGTVAVSGHYLAQDGSLLSALITGTEPGEEAYLGESYLDASYLNEPYALFP